MTCQKGYVNIIVNKTKRGAYDMENNIIKQIRIEKGMTLNELANKTGISAGYLCHLEKGSRNNPSIYIMKKISKALGKTITEVFLIEE